MAETTAPDPVDTAGAAATDSSKARFAKAIEEAKAGVQALGKEAQGRADDYREKASTTRGEWLDEAKAYGNQAKEKATEFAVEGKARASEAILTLGKMVEENVETIDARLGAKYGDYARKASTSIQDAAARLDAKDLGEIGEEARAFVRKSPGLAIGLAAVAGYILARAFRGSSDGASDGSSD